MTDIYPESLRGIPFLPGNFLDTPSPGSCFETARVVVIPVPYDSTTSYRGGARDGPRAIIAASRQLEDFDLEFKGEISTVGIHTMPEIEAHLGDPRAMAQRVEDLVHPLAVMGKLVCLLGGEHSITIGSVKAFARVYSDLSVLYLDAHADLRQDYMGTSWGHASVARRVSELCPLVQVGVRSLSEEEYKTIQEKMIPVFFHDGTKAMATVVDGVLPLLSTHVYVSVDLDVFDPSFMSAVGTPEPGGLGWGDVLGLLKKVGENKSIVGFDITELSPREGPEACAFLAAKLAYKLMGYATLLRQGET
ncbi:MAG: agmatinase [Chloroflexi bacterium]|nr:agmatinase [Chloroflexota bacterium]